MTNATNTSTPISFDVDALVGAMRNQVRQARDQFTRTVATGDFGPAAVAAFLDVLDTWNRWIVEIEVTNVAAAQSTDWRGPIDSIADFHDTKLAAAFDTAAMNMNAAAARYDAAARARLAPRVDAKPEPGQVLGSRMYRWFEIDTVVADGRKVHGYTGVKSRRHGYVGPVAYEAVKAWVAGETDTILSV